MSGAAWRVIPRASGGAFVAFVVASAIASGCGDRIALGTLPGDDAAVIAPDASCGFFCEASVPDARAPWYPCAGKTCGETCQGCAPNDPQCTVPAATRACDRNGACTEAPIACDGGPTISDVDGGDATVPYAPCAGKRCDDPCTLCPPDDSTCVEASVVKTCGPDGVCSEAPKTCS